MQYNGGKIELYYRNFVWSFRLFYCQILSEGDVGITILRCSNLQERIKMRKNKIYEFSICIDIFGSRAIFSDKFIGKNIAKHI